MAEILGTVLALTWKAVMLGVDVLTNGFGTTGSVGT